MKYRIRYPESRYWHKWFAWHPVRTDVTEGEEYIVWLEYVEREIQITGISGQLKYTYYRLPKQPLGRFE